MLKRLNQTPGVSASASGKMHSSCRIKHYNTISRVHLACQSIYCTPQRLITEIVFTVRHHTVLLTLFTPVSILPGLWLLNRCTAASDEYGWAMYCTVIIVGGLISTEWSRSSPRCLPISISGGSLRVPVKLILNIFLCLMSGASQRNTQDRFYRLTCFTPLSPAASLLWIMEKQLPSWSTSAALPPVFASTSEGPAFIVVYFLWSLSKQLPEL